MVGDAAGQVKVTTVGGTVTGIEGANAAARAILKRTSYRHELSSLKRELDLHWFIRVMLDRLDNRGILCFSRFPVKLVEEFSGSPQPRLYGTGFLASSFRSAASLSSGSSMSLG